MSALRCVVILHVNMLYNRSLTVWPTRKVNIYPADCMHTVLLSLSVLTGTMSNTCNNPQEGIKGLFSFHVFTINLLWGVSHPPNKQVKGQYHKDKTPWRWTGATNSCWHEAFTIMGKRHSWDRSAHWWQNHLQSFKYGTVRGWWGGSSRVVPTVKWTLSPHGQELLCVIVALYRAADHGHTTNMPVGVESCTCLYTK